MEATMSNDSQAVPARTDFYTVVHKGLRKRLFEAVILAGATDYAEPEHRARLVQVVGDIVTALRQHAEHEEEFLHPILAEVLPEAAKSLEAEHAEHHRALDDVERELAVAVAERTELAGHRAYRTLARFTAQFLAHVEEEEAGQPRLWELVDEARLAAAMTAFKRSRMLERNLAPEAPAPQGEDAQVLVAGSKSGERSTVRSEGGSTSTDEASRVHWSSQA
jgi:hypothetical protein